MYIRDTQGAMILLDVRRKFSPLLVDDRAFASNINEQVRLLWEHTGVSVVVCTSEGRGIPRKCGRAAVARQPLS